VKRVHWVGLTLFVAGCHLAIGLEAGAPQCRVDGETNGLETDVDCGGPCAPCTGEEPGASCCTAAPCGTAGELGDTCSVDEADYCVEPLTCVLVMGDSYTCQ
jgi:hypothetical protein